MEYKLINEDFKDNYIEQLIRTYDASIDINNLLKPNSSMVQSPLDLDNIEEGARLLDKILRSNGKIVLVVDPDVDGYTSSGIIWHYIKRLYPKANLDYRVHEGKAHGLEDMIDRLENDDDIDLIILPDASSNDEEYHYRLKEIGIPVLVLDHHLTNEYSNSAIVINNQLSKNYKNKQLTGAGVVYQFCRYLDSYYNVNYADDFIDLAALGIISDMGSVLELENAYIIKKGLEKENKNLFFQTLLDRQSYSIGNKINSISIAFYITPLINALIRVGTLDEKEKLFEAFINGTKIVPSTKRGEKGKTEPLCVQMARTCTNARVHQNKYLDEAIERIDFKIQDRELNKNKLLIVELDEDDILPSTINGLLAMRLSAKYKLPTLVLRENSEGLARGSGRGINNSPFNDLRGYLEKTGLCEYAQGHSQAHGVGILASQIPRLISRANTDLANFNFGQTYYEVNFQKDGSDRSIIDIIKDIDKYHSIYGQGCPEPLIAVNNINIPRNMIQIMGTNKDTVKIVYAGVSYMMFKAKEFIERINSLDYNAITLEIVGRASMNEWCGQKTPQIFIDDYNIYDTRLVF